MRPKASASNLVQAVKELSLEWRRTQGAWHDVKSQEFERVYLEELPDHVARTTLIMEEIDELLAKVRRDCE
jgi:hypothetical protein